MKKLLIDDHTGERLSSALIGVWISDRGRIGAAIATPLYSINEIYIAEDENLHLGVASVGPNTSHDSNTTGVIETPFDKWTLVRMSPEDVYSLLKRASKRTPTYPPLKQSS